MADLSIISILFQSENQTFVSTMLKPWVTANLSIVSVSLSNGNLTVASAIFWRPIFHILSIVSIPLSSAEAPVSKHQRKKREQERWREKTGARGTMGRGSLRAPQLYFPKARL